MVEKKESQVALKKCLKGALSDVAKLQEKMDDHYYKIESPKPAVDQRGFERRDEPATRTKSVVDKKKESEAVTSVKVKKKQAKKPPGELAENTAQKDTYHNQKSAKKTGKKKKKKSDAENGQVEKYAMDEID
jgi:hypothetical protein